MNKQEFTKQLKTIKALCEKMNSLGGVINKTLCANSTPSVVDFHYPIINELTYNISKRSGIDKEEILDLIYKGSLTYYNHECTVRTDVTTPEQFWDYWKKDQAEEIEKVSTFSDYQVKAMSTCTQSSMNIAYMSLGLVAEVGEVADKFAKGVRKELIKIDNNQLDDTFQDTEEWSNSVKAEVGDCLWFLAGICDVMGWDLADIAQGNVDKLQDRQKRNVIVGEGDKR